MKTPSSEQRNVSFLEGVFELASSHIKDRYLQLPTGQRQQVLRFAESVLKSPELKRNQKLRAGAVRLVVALLPETFSLLEELFQDCFSPLWYEVQFTALSALDRDDLGEAQRARVLRLVHNYVLNINSEAGFAAWKAGDILGDEWRDSGTVKMLGELLLSAKHVAGRKAALHGIEHALNKATPAEAQQLWECVRKAAQNDRSAEVRRAAKLTLKGIGCGPPLRSA